MILTADLAKHYSGWALVEEIWLYMPPLPAMPTVGEPLRCFAMKHIYRVEGKGNPVKDVQKAINYVEKLSQLFGDPEAPLVRGEMSPVTIRSVLELSPRGFDCRTLPDQLRLSVFCNLVNACRFGAVLDDLVELKKYYEAVQ